MRNLTIIVIILLLLICKPLISDSSPPPSPFDDVRVTMYIHGFHEHPEQPFFLVEWNYWRDYSNYRRITEDSIVIKPNWKYNGEWISINPDFDPEQTSFEFYTTLKDKINPFTYYLLDEYYLGYIQRLTFLGFESVENHYRILKKEQMVRRSHLPSSVLERENRVLQKILPFSIELDRLVLNHEDFQLIIRNNKETAQQRSIFPRDNIEKLNLFYVTRFSRLMIQGSFNNQDIIDLICIAKTMSDSEVIGKSQRFTYLLLTVDFLLKNMHSGVGRIPYVELTDYENLMFSKLDMHMQDTFHDSRFPPYIVSVMTYISGFWRAMIFSILIECFVIFALFRFITGKEIKTRKYLIRLMLSCSLGTAVTISALWWFFPLLIHKFLIAILVGEIFAVGFEGLIYNRILNISVKSALLLSLAANMVSFAGGYILLY